MSNNLLQSLNNQNKDKEPALRIGISASTVAGIISLILYFFPNLSEEYVTVILLIMVVIVPTITAFLTRRSVWSPYSVDQIVEIVNVLAKADKRLPTSAFRSGRAPIPPIKTLNPKFPEE